MIAPITTTVSSLVVCFFFFSSRRRHTRYWRDWSSDVCSSDLRLLWRRRPLRLEAEILRDAMLAAAGTINLEPYGPAFKPPIAAEAMRSEERRVGKECRSRWSPYH